MLDLDSKITTLPRINDKYAASLKRLGVETIRDFLFHFPFRYEDYSERVPIDELTAGQTATVMGEVLECKMIRTWKRKMMITEATISDDTGTIRAVWFNQPYIADSLSTGKGVRLSGKISLDKKGEIYFSNPAYELSSREPTNTGRLVPIYPETEGVTSRWIRWQLQLIFKAGFEIEDPIPEHILQKLHLPEITEALKYIHFPKNEAEFEVAQKRFAFEEMFLVQLMSLRAKRVWQSQRAVTIPFDENLIKKFVANLPFTLTNAQRKTAFQIFKDLEKSVPMNRLINGDVGSGKTVVAAMASLAVANSGHQIALMAPTEVLASQHFESISKLFAKQKISIALLTNSYQMINSNFKFKISNLKSISNEKIIKTKQPNRKELLDKIVAGEIDLIIGTHALIQKDVHFKNLALVIVDEQHRFGVSQRAYLQQEISTSQDGIKNKIPHLLSMTATPIPRTLSLAFFGNLDLSVLDEMPKNRLTIKTELVSRLKVQEIYDFVRSEIKSGRQAFIIFPLVERSKALTELKAATQEHERLSKKVFPDLKLGLLHGKLKASEKEKVMEDFKNGKYDILVATSVVEVGIDVPNATVMMIEDADRFGLSQLHQFRGRVGRSIYQSYCFLLTQSSTAKAKSRLKALVSHSSGFDIAEQDLKLRGPGEFLGTRQSGLPDLAMQHIANTKLIEFAHDFALETLTENPTLKKHPLLVERLKKFTQSVHLE